MRKKYTREQYVDQLKDVDAFSYGVQLRKDNKSHDMDTDITRAYSGGSDDNPAWAELDRIYNEVEKGWHHQNHVFAKEKYEIALVDFKKTIPNVGDIVYLEHMSNKGKYFRCIVEVVAEKRDSVVLRYLDEKNAYGQTSFVIASYSFGGFPKFYKEKPER